VRVLPGSSRYNGIGTRSTDLLRSTSSSPSLLLPLPSSILSPDQPCCFLVCFWLFSWAVFCFLPCASHILSYHSIVPSLPLSLPHGPPLANRYDLRTPPLSESQTPALASLASSLLISVPAFARCLHPVRRSLRPPLHFTPSSESAVSLHLPPTVRDVPHILPLQDKTFRTVLSPISNGSVGSHNVDDLNNRVSVFFLKSFAYSHRTTGAYSSPNSHW
jgi:hypothetical protein